ncbi:MAG: fasciclin domain-containing protein [Phormidesmis sp.]
MRFSISNKSLKKLAGLSAALLILPVAVSCDNQPADTVDTATTEEVTPDAMTEPAVTEGDTIVDVATANGSFNTLVSALQAAGLAETLSEPGPYTVFAPTDEAFAALPEGVLDKLLLPENQEVLSQILTYHVVDGAVTSADLESGMVATLEGTDVDVVVDGETVTVNGATVEQPDVTASNGVIHVIDTVLLPAGVDPAAL